MDSWMEEIDKIYVLVHPEYEKDRFERMKVHMSSLGLPMNKVLFAAACWGSELKSADIFNVWDPYLRPGIPTLTWKCRCLSKGEVSLVLNFYAVIKDAVKNKYSKIIILESDVFLRSDFTTCLNDLMIDLKDKPWDYVSLGEGIGTRPSGVPGSYWSPTKAYPAPHQFVFRCTDSMLLRGEFLEKLLGTLIPFRECLDWELNYQLAVHRAVALWADPPLAEQGSSRNRIASLLPA
jgi:hypothetical protein